MEAPSYTSNMHTSTYLDMLNEYETWNFKRLMSSDPFIQVRYHLGSRSCLAAKYRLLKSLTLIVCTLMHIHMHILYAGH